MIRKLLLLLVVITYLQNTSYAHGIDPAFIAHSFHERNGNHDGHSVDTYKAIANVINRLDYRTNPCLPFEAGNCSNANFVPITLSSTHINVPAPITKVLTGGKAVDVAVADKSSHVLVQWKSENNQLIDYFEVQRKDNNGDFKTIGLVLSSEASGQDNYAFKDKVTVRDLESSYRIKTIDKDRQTSYSTVQTIRLGGSVAEQVKVFPNPENDTIRINLPDLTGIYVNRIYNAEGRLVLTSNVTSSNPSVIIKSLQVDSYFMELYHPATGMRYYTQFKKQ